MVASCGKGCQKVSGEGGIGPEVPLEEAEAGDEASLGTPLFQGEYTHALDPKGRLTIPACFRTVLAEGLMITRGYEPCIVGYTLAEWAELAARAARLSRTRKSARSFRRIVFAGGTKVVPDSMGRILLPDYLRTYAHIDGQAVVLGVNNNIEIWNPDTWRQTLTEDIAHIDDITADLSELGM